MQPRLTLSLALGLSLATPAQAHDYWLLPESFFPVVGKKVAVRLHVGDHFESEAERPYQPKLTTAFQWVSAKGTRDLQATSVDGAKPVATISFDVAGNYLIRMDRGPSYIKLAADKFNAYLAEEGLTEILEQRRKRGEDKAEGRERYSRCLKALVHAGGVQDDVWKRALGQTLEIVPLSNPYACKPGDKLAVKVLYNGKPLAGAKLSAYCRPDTGNVATQSATTAADGTATVRLDRAGVWLVRLVHMRRVIGDAETDWESHWAAYTFGLAKSP